MPLTMDGSGLLIGRENIGWRQPNRESECVRIALVNNMPDSALEDTELQFFSLLRDASEGIDVCLQLFHLPSVPRGERGREHLARRYSEINGLWNNRFDGVIVTGTEPRQSDLRKESYWGALADLFDWAERNTVSTVLSCLAAHAGLLYSDGIARHPLSRKQLGVFEHEKACEHPLTSCTPRVIRIPHSRWNEVRREDVGSCGYQVLTSSAKAGVDLFIRMKRKSLFVHFQGHPEYAAATLLKEYRRDVKRFLKGEIEAYPTAPESYFDEGTTERLMQFREDAIANRREELLSAFPYDVIADALPSTWHASSVQIYRNWLQYIASRKEAPTFATVA